jgi:hypothetical protein
MKEYEAKRIAKHYRKPGDYVRYREAVEAVQKFEESKQGRFQSEYREEFSGWLGDQEAKRELQYDISGRRLIHHGGVSEPYFQKRHFVLPSGAERGNGESGPQIYGDSTQAPRPATQPQPQSNHQQIYKYEPKPPQPHAPFRPQTAPSKSPYRR